MSFRFKTLQRCPWGTQSKCLSTRTQMLPSACDRSLSASEKTGKGIGRPLCQVSKCAYGHSWCMYLEKIFFLIVNFIVLRRNLDHMGKDQQLQEHCYPFLSVRVVFLCQTLVWLPVFGTFNVHTDVNDCNCTLGLSGKSVLTVVFCDKCIVFLQTKMFWLSCCVFQLVTVMLCVPACDCHVVCSSPG